jgi:hypothetical protein
LHGGSARKCGFIAADDFPIYFKVFILSHFFAALEAIT